MAASRQMRHSTESFLSKNSKEEWPKVSKTGVLDRLKLIRMGVLTLSFYILTNSVQRFAGMVSIHSGQNFLATRSFGLFSTTACCLLSREIQDQLLPVNKLKHPSDYLESPKKNAEDIIRRAYLGLGVFSLLEKKSFLTALPSSVIALGVHAQQSPLFQKGAVLSTSKVATPTQRQMIQILGNRYGCHQCGSRQIFAAKRGFIADHMPPTSFVERLNDVWWRKKFNIKVSFSLPQIEGDQILINFSTGIPMTGRYFSLFLLTILPLLPGGSLNLLMHFRCFKFRRSSSCCGRSVRNASEYKERL